MVEAAVCMCVIVCKILRDRSPLRVSPLQLFLRGFFGSGLPSLSSWGVEKGGSAQGHPAAGFSSNPSGSHDSSPMPSPRTKLGFAQV